MMHHPRMRKIILVCACLLSACVQTQQVQQNPAPVLQFTKPTMVGDALPSPTIPLRSIKGIIGSVPKADQETIDLFIESFEAHVFNFEYDGAWQWVTKWNSFIRLKIEGDSEPRAAAADAIRLLQQITGIPFSFGESEKVFVAVDTPEKKAFNDDYYCFATMHNRHDGSMDMGFVFIGEKIRGPILRMCLIEELSQIMGPGNDTETVEASLWRPKKRQDLISLPKYNSLTWHDAIILRVLYNERIKPGMHKDDAMPIVRELIAKELTGIERRIAPRTTGPPPRSAGAFL